MLTDTPHSRASPLPQLIYSVLGLLGLPAGRVLHAFGQYSTASEAASPFTQWHGADVVLYKPFEGRARDTFVLGYGRAVPNPRSRDAQKLAAFNAGTDYPNLNNAEQLIELSYGYQATPWLTVRPDVQYIIEPGAFSGENIDNALVAGRQVKATF